MPVSMKAIRSQVIQGLLVAVLSPSAPLAAMVLRPKPAAQEWQARYEGGTEPFQDDAKLGITVNREKIVLQTRGKGPKATLAITASAVTQVSYLWNGEPMAEKVLGAHPYSSCPGDQGAFFCLAGALFMEAVLHPFESTQHLVSVRWLDSDRQQHEADLLVGKHQYQSLLTELQRVTRKPWKDELQEAIEVKSTRAVAPDPGDDTGDTPPEKPHDQALPECKAGLGSRTFAYDFFKAPAGPNAGLDPPCAKKLTEAEKAELLAN